MVVVDWWIDWGFVVVDGWVGCLLFCIVVLVVGGGVVDWVEIGFGVGVVIVSLCDGMWWNGFLWYVGVIGGGLGFVVGVVGFLRLVLMKGGNFCVVMMVGLLGDVYNFCFSWLGDVYVVLVFVDLFGCFGFVCCWLCLVVLCLLWGCVFVWFVGLFGNDCLYDWILLWGLDVGWLADCLLVVVFFVGGVCWAGVVGYVGIVGVVICKLIGM